MNELVQAILRGEEKLALQELIREFQTRDQQYFLRNEIAQVFADYCRNLQKPAYFFHASSLGRLVQYTHELILEAENIWLLLRPWIGSQQVWWLAADLTQMELKTPQVLLEVRDRLVNRYQPHLLGIDFGPFYKNSPSISDPRNIGQGLAFLNHYFCNQLSSDPAYWLEGIFQALQRHGYDRIPLLISDRISSGPQLVKQVRQAIQQVSQLAPETPYEKFDPELQELGFAPGWGNTAARVSETLQLLERLLDAPEPSLLEAFVSRIPAIFRILLVSIHGWVGQDGVLGRPETMGQVVYVLEQARSLEQRLYEELRLGGLEFLGIRPQVVILTRLIPNCEGTQCNLRLEKVEGTENSWILRVPFQEFNPRVTQNWISKFEIWPYLESFATDAEPQILAQFGGRPNLILGNYSDGNLVAFLLARRLNVLQGNIAHVLEKSKYLFSDLYWQDFEPHYHFSVQFTADLISMNAADFILTASYQEIVGTPESFGQYESYKCFTMPQLYHVVDGIDLFSPKFNCIPPGVDPKIFFPYTQLENRCPSDRQRLNALLFEVEDPQILGQLEQPQKRPILAIGPLTPAKNLTGLVEFFGQNPALQARCNLILLSSRLQPTEAVNAEEAGELTKLHQLIQHYDLWKKVRCIGLQLSSPDLGEAYRVIGDRQGVFVHFARFEAFGRVILEAMVSGLPTFATQFGGALEIIQEGENGFQINPTDWQKTAQVMLNFLTESEADPQVWQRISTQAIQRVQNKYNWQHHTLQLLLLAKIFSFWNYIHPERREALLRYLEALFYLIYQPRAAEILEQHLHL